MSQNAASSSGVYKSKLPRRQLEATYLTKQTPKAYTEQSKLYIMHFCFAFVSRMWDMGIVLMLAEITNNSLFIVAVSGFLCSLSVFLFMPFIGQSLDKLNRMSAVSLCLASKITVVSLAYLLCGYMTHESTDTSKNQFIVYLLPVLCALAALSFSTITQSVEKDWIVVLSDGDSAWLSSTNSVMSQIDLGCASLAPAVTGFLFVYLTTPVVAATLLLTNAVTTLCLYVFMRNLYFSWTALAFRAAKQPQPATLPQFNAEEYSEFSDDQQSSNVVCCSPCKSRFKNYVTDFLQSGCAGVMVSYAFLYLTVLSFGSLMTVYLRWSGVTTEWIGICRGLAALTGFAGAALFPFVNNAIGLYRTAQVSILFQSVLVTLAASSFFWAPNKIVSVVVVIVAVLMSRGGLWMFDLSVRQIAQETIPENVRGKVNGQWKSLTAFFEMLGYAIAASVPDPQHFWVLTTISAAMVVSAALLYTVSNPFSGVNCHYCSGDREGGVMGVIGHPNSGGAGGAGTFRYQSVDRALTSSSHSAGGVEMRSKK